MDLAATHQDERDSKPAPHTRNNYQNTPDSATARLNDLRLGQPTPGLMVKLSPTVFNARGYIESEFVKRQPIVKLIEGEMGSGKSTVLEVFSQSATKNQLPVIRINLPYATNSSLGSTIFRMLGAPEIIGDCIERIKELAQSGNEAGLDLIEQSFAGNPIRTVYKNIVNHIRRRVEQGEDVESSFSARMSDAFRVWLVDGKVTPLKLFASPSVANAEIISHASDSEMADLFACHLKLYKACDVYPVWVIDEFESIIGLRANKQQAHLGMYRDIVDAIFRIKWGALMLYSTPDGVKTILNYPALYDRLQGPEDFLITSPTWRTDHFSVWSADTVRQEFRQLYLQAAGEGDYVANLVADNLNELNKETFTDFAEKISNAVDVVPRIRLKEITFAIDRLAQGTDNFTKNLTSLTPDIIQPKQSVDTDTVIPKPQSERDLHPQPHEVPEALKKEAHCHHDYKWQKDISELLSRLNDDVNSDFDDSNSPGEPADNSFDLSATDTGNDFEYTETFDDPDNQDDVGTLPTLHYRQRITHLKQPVLEERIIKTQKHQPHILAAYLSAYRDAGGSVDKIMSRDTGLENFRLTGNHRVYFDHIEEAITDTIPTLMFEWALHPNIKCTVENDALQDYTKYAVLIKVTQRAPNPDYAAALELRQQEPEKKIKLPTENIDIETSTHIDPFATIGEFRHFVYTVIAQMGAIPADAAIDRFVFRMVSKIFRYKPRTSRLGIRFHNPSLSISGLLSRPTSFADEDPDT
jgi:hypothetical protein